MLVTKELDRELVLFWNDVLPKRKGVQNGKIIGDFLSLDSDQMMVSHSEMCNPENERGILMPYSHDIIWNTFRAIREFGPLAFFMLTVNAILSWLKSKAKIDDATTVLDFIAQTLRNPDDMETLSSDLLRKLAKMIVKSLLSGHADIVVANSSLYPDIFANYAGGLLCPLSGYESPPYYSVKGQDMEMEHAESLPGFGFVKYSHKFVNPETNLEEIIVIVDLPEPKGRVPDLYRKKAAAEARRIKNTLYPDEAAADRDIKSLVQTFPYHVLSNPVKTEKRKKTGVELDGSGRTVACPITPGSPKKSEIINILLELDFDFTDVIDIDASDETRPEILKKAYRVVLVSNKDVDAKKAAEIYRDVSHSPEVKKNLKKRDGGTYYFFMDPPPADFSRNDEQSPLGSLHQKSLSSQHAQEALVSVKIMVEAVKSKLSKTTDGFVAYDQSRRNDCA
jgi:hypothetical protein